MREKERKTVLRLQCDQICRNFATNFHFSTSLAFLIVHLGGIWNHFEQTCAKNLRYQAICHYCTWPNNEKII